LSGKNNLPKSKIYLQIYKLRKIIYCIIWEKKSLIYTKYFHNNIQNQLFFSQCMVCIHACSCCCCGGGVAPALSGRFGHIASFLPGQQYRICIYMHILCAQRILHFSTSSIFVNLMKFLIFMRARWAVMVGGWGAWQRLLSLGLTSRRDMLHLPCILVGSSG